MDNVIYALLAGSFGLHVVSLVMYMEQVRTVNHLTRLFEIHDKTIRRL